MNYRTRFRNNIIIDHLIYVILLIVLFLGFYIKPVFLNYQPNLSNTVLDSKIFKMHLDKQDQESNWSSNTLSGFPIFRHSGIEAQVTGFVKKILSGNTAYTLFYLLLGGFGIYTIFIFYNSHKVIALVSASIFSLSYYFINFFLLGRYDILRFIGFLPWVLFLTLYLKNRRSFLASGLLAISLIFALKDPVPGLIVSLMILTTLFWIIDCIHSCLRRKVKTFIIFSLLLVTAYISALLAISYPGFYLLKLQSLISGNLTGLPLISILMIYCNLIVIFVLGVIVQYGLSNINDEDSNFYRNLRSVITGLIILLLLLVIMRLFFDLLFISTVILTILAALILTGILILLYRYEKISSNVFNLLYAVVSLTCLFILGSGALNTLNSQTLLPEIPEQSIADNFFDDDQDVFRIYPLGAEFRNNLWGIHNQTIGGNYDYRLYRYNRVLDKCLNTEIQNRVPINWNIVNMLNVKYLIYKDKISVNDLKYSFYDLDNKNIIYKNINYLPRAWFVDELEFIETESEILKRLNNGDFDPSKTAIVERELTNIGSSLNSEIKIDSVSSGFLRISTKTDTTSFLVLSEVFYPDNWKAYLNGSIIPVHAVNFTLCGVVIPAGENELILKFELVELPILLRLNLVALIITAILIFIGIYQYIRKNYKGEIVYVIKR